MKNKKTEHIINISSVFILLLIIVYSFTYSFKINLFKINNILISGNQFIDNDTIKHIINDEIKNKNIYNIKIEKLNNKIEAHAFIQNVKIYTKLPSTIAITIKEVNPIVLYQEDEKYFLIDEKNKKIQANMNAINFYSVPIITEYDNIEDHEYKKIINSLKYIANNNIELFDKINEIKFKNEYMLLIVNDTTVKINRYKMINNISKLIQFVNETNNHKQINTYKYINLAIPNQIIVKDKTI